MAVREPQFDLPHGVSGGSDVWDEGLAGKLLTADYFVSAPPTTSGSHLRAWTGSAWTLGELKRWDGAIWLGAQLQRWNGTSWISVP